MKKNNAWNIKHLVDESFVPSTQQASVHIILKIVGFLQKDHAIMLCNLLPAVFNTYECTVGHRHLASAALVKAGLMTLMMTFLITA